MGTWNRRSNLLSNFPEVLIRYPKLPMIRSFLLFVILALVYSSCSTLTSSVTPGAGVVIVERNIQPFKIDGAKLEHLERVSSADVVAVWKSTVNAHIVSLLRDSLVEVWSTPLMPANIRIENEAIHIDKGNVIIPYAVIDDFKHNSALFEKTLDLGNGHTVDSHVVATKFSDDLNLETFPLVWSPDSSKILTYKYHRSFTQANSFRFTTILFDPAMHVLAIDSIALTYDSHAQRFIGASPTNQGEVFLVFENIERSSFVDAPPELMPVFDAVRYDLQGNKSVTKSHVEFHNDPSEHVTKVKIAAGAQGNGYLCATQCTGNAMTHLTLVDFTFTLKDPTVTRIAMDESTVEKAGISSPFQFPDIRALNIMPGENSVVAVLEDVRVWSDFVPKNEMVLQVYPDAARLSSSAPEAAFIGVTAGNVLVQAFDLSGAATWQWGFTKDQASVDGTTASFVMSPTKHHSLVFWYPDGGLWRREVELRSGVQTSDKNKMADVGSAVEMSSAVSLGDRTIVFARNGHVYQVTGK